MSLSFTWTWIIVGAFAALNIHATVTSAAEGSPTSAEARARAFIADHESRIRPMEIAVGLAWWQANTSGKDKDFAAKEEAQNKLDRCAFRSEAFCRA